MPPLSAAPRKIVRRVRLAARALAGSTAPTGIYDDMDPAFAPHYRRAAPFTMTSIERMYALWQAIEYIGRAGIPGDVVECGVWRGGSSMLAALALLHTGEERRMWLYDTYEGMTAPSERDRNWRGESAAARLATQERIAGVFNDWSFATLDDVERQMATVEYPRNLLNFVKGPVEITIPSNCPEMISLLRLDTDWYESTRHELEHLWPRLSVGGVLIIDDYGHWQGAREATDEFFAAHGLREMLHRIDYTGRLAIKLPASTVG
jgi:O-methyltransferase